VGGTSFLSWLSYLDRNESRANKIEKRKPSPYRHRRFTPH
jgi:hypothetical protein